jgi:hypothetical protein
MALTFGLYVVSHSPLRQVIAQWSGREAAGCYFVCDPASLDLRTLLGRLSAWMLIGSALLAASAVTDWLDGVTYERPLVLGLAALALVVVPSAAIAGLATWTDTALLRPPLGPTLAMLPSIAVSAMRLRAGWRPSWPRLHFWPASRLLRVVVGLVAGLLVASIAINLMHPPTGGDGLSYHAPLAVFLWRDGNLSTFLDRAPGTWALANPGTAELWYGLLRVAGGEHLANFGQLPFALIGSAAAGAFTRRLGLARGSAWLASLAFLLCPIVVMQLGMQPNDVIGSALLMSTMALASAPAATWTLPRAGLLGLGLGLTATTKLALLPLVVGAGGFVLAAVAWKAAGRHRRVALGQLMMLAVGFLLVAGPWWARNVARYGNPVYPAGIPLLGGGVFVSDFGKIDREFVPHPAAWPLYPLIEPQDDRSGYGALFALGLIPGLALAARRGKRQPLVLYGLTLACMLPAWWLLTMHEPRFFLAHAGLGFAFLPWALAALPRRHRWHGGALVAAAAGFSALVTVDQALLPFGRQPTNRLEFYDRVWGVDPAAVGLPEREGLLHNTGYAPEIPEYAAYYPLLGPTQSRRVIPVDVEGTTDFLLATMRTGHLRYAYVAAAPEFQATVERLYDPALFELVHLSAIERGEKSGARRYLYRSLVETGQRRGIRRYLFRLREGAVAGATAPRHPT